MSRRQPPDGALAEAEYERVRARARPDVWSEAAANLVGIEGPTTAWIGELRIMPAST